MRQHARALFFHAPASLAFRSVRAIQIKRGDLEWSAIFRRLGTSLSQLLTKVNAGSHKHCVPLGQHQDYYKRLPWTIFFVFENRHSKYQKVKNYRKLRDLFYLKNKFLNTASGIVLLLLFKCFSSLSSLHYPFIETDQQVPHLSWP